MSFILMAELHRHAATCETMGHTATADVLRRAAAKIDQLKWFGVGDAPWGCRANRTADPPQDCDWPSCGCDRYANKVIEALSDDIGRELGEAIGIIEWMSGSPSFGPEGEAHEGWVKAREQLKEIRAAHGRLAALGGDKLTASGSEVGSERSDARTQSTKGDHP